MSSTASGLSWTWPEGAQAPGTGVRWAEGVADLVANGRRVRHPHRAVGNHLGHLRIGGQLPGFGGTDGGRDGVEEGELVDAGGLGRRQPADDARFGRTGGRPPGGAGRPGVGRGGRAGPSARRSPAPGDPSSRRRPTVHRGGACRPLLLHPIRPRCRPAPARTPEPPPVDRTSLGPPSAPPPPSAPDPAPFAGMSAAG